MTSYVASMTSCLFLVLLAPLSPVLFYSDMSGRVSTAYRHVQSITFRQIRYNWTNANNERSRKETQKYITVMDVLNKPKVLLLAVRVVLAGFRISMMAHH